MKKLVCEQCGSPDLVKEDDHYICPYCGCKYIPGDTGELLVPVDKQNVKEQSVPTQTVPEIVPPHKGTAASAKPPLKKTEKVELPKIISISFGIAVFVGVIVILAAARDSERKEKPAVSQVAAESERTEETTEKDIVSETIVQTGESLYDLETSEQIMKKMTGGLSVVVSRLMDFLGGDSEALDTAIANDELLDLTENQNWIAFQKEAGTWTEEVLSEDISHVAEPFAEVCGVMQDLAEKMLQHLDSVGTQIRGKKFYETLLLLLGDMDAAVAETERILEPYTVDDAVNEAAESEIQEALNEVQAEEKIPLPYVGMSENEIDRTGLGLSYYNGANHDTINGNRTTVDIYFYIQSDYGIIYVARVANGKVISVKDYRDDPWYFPAFIEGVKKNGRKTKASY